MGLIEWMFPLSIVLYLVVYALVAVVLVICGLWAVVKLGFLVKLPELIGRFAAQIVESYRAYGA